VSKSAFQYTVFTFFSSEGEYNQRVYLQEFDTTLIKNDLLIQSHFLILILCISLEQRNYYIIKI